MSPILRKKLFTIFLSVARVTLFCMLFVFMQGQSFSQTSEQIQQLNSLPAAQRAALLQQLGMSGQQQQALEADQLDFPDTIVQLPNLEDDNLINESVSVPRLAPGDTLVIEFSERAADWIPVAPLQMEFTSPQQAFAATAGAANATSTIVQNDFGLDSISESSGSTEISESELLEKQEILEQLVLANPYELDSNGFIHLPAGVPPIRLAGLNVEEAMIRIRTEPSLVWLQPVVTFLPLESFGIDTLEHFGYGLFRGVPTTFAPATDVPVPAEYIMGPGDTINVMLFGNNNEQYEFIVSREGIINFPEIGPISVAGLSFEEFKSVISQRIEEQMIGVRSSITLGRLRSIRVFVLGDVQQPGSYTVSGLSTMTNALFVSGGINDVGSLRQIELRRGGEVVTTLDLYDLLLRGDTSGDIRLQPGDVIFAPPIGDSISVYGDVRRPAIYELNGENSIEQVISIAGGFTSQADLSQVKLERMMPAGTTVHNIDFDSQINVIQSLQDGDVLLVQSKVERLDKAIRLHGNVYHPGVYSWHEGFTLTDLISSRDSVRPGSDLSYILIRRELQPNVLTEVFSADLRSAWANPGGIEDVQLESRDTVYVFDRLNSRQPVVYELLDELRAQVFENEIFNVVTVSGEVTSPGDYPLEPGMTVAELVKAGGGLKDSAYTVEAELVRYSSSRVTARSVEVINIDLNTSEYLLSPYDHLNIKVVPNWSIDEEIEIFGEVLFPGTYPLVKGESLRNVIERSGGFTDYAFLDGALFVRENLKEREAEQLEQLANRLEADVQSLSLAVNSPESARAITAGTALVSRLRSTQPVGRLVIDLHEIMQGNDQAIVLKDGDRLYIPAASQEVTVLGEVQYATSHLFKRNLNRDAYISMSGGTTENADINRIYTVRPNGRVDVLQRSRWFVGNTMTNTMMPGDTVVVPADTSVSMVPIWAAATQVVYNIAIAATALNSF